VVDSNKSQALPDFYFLIPNIKELYTTDCSVPLKKTHKHNPEAFQLHRTSVTLDSLRELNVILY
jgi:hypothetical protein